MSEPDAGEASAGEQFKPFVPASSAPIELSFRAALIGSLLGVLFGASSVYLALKVGLTVSASIPIAVLSIPIFRALGKGSILENNMTQTVGSAGESIAAGVVFTVPALIILGYDLDIGATTMIALTGGWLGVLLMIPLRKNLIVKEHGKLMYPEGTACAEVLEAGEKKGVQAGLVFLGLATGLVYKLLYKAFWLWKEVPERALSWYKGAEVGVEASPELMGVGYIIGPKIASIMAAGGVLSFLVLIPLIRFFGEHLVSPLFPGAVPIAEMSNYGIRSAYVAYIGAGAVAAGGILSLGRALPTIVKAFASGVRGFKDAGGAGGAAVPRTARDLPLWVTGAGAIGLVLVLWLQPLFPIKLVGAILMVVFGFFFSTVSSRICGQIGSSSNPVSGMTIATILITCLIFVSLGWTGASYRPLALVIGAVVCIAAANAGATSQDLKTGFLVGATPARQQIGLLIGVTTSAVVVGWTLLFINTAYTTTVWKGDTLARYRMTVPAGAPHKTGPDGVRYRVVRLRSDDASGKLGAGTYLVDAAGGIAFVRQDVGPVHGGAAHHAAVPAGAQAAQVGPEGVGGPRYHVVDVGEVSAVPAGVYEVGPDGRLARKRWLGLAYWVDASGLHREYRAAPGELKLPAADATAVVTPGEYLADAEGRLVWRIGSHEVPEFVEPVTGETVATSDLGLATEVGPDGQRYRVALREGRRLLVDAAGVVRFNVRRAAPERIFRPASNAHYRADLGAAKGQELGPDGKSYAVLELAHDDASAVVPSGKYLVRDDGMVAFVEDPGVGGREPYKVDKAGRPLKDAAGKSIQATKLTAPKANLMAVLIDGLLTGKLPWALVLFGVFITLVLELSAIEALAFAVGLYLPLSSSTPIWAGGLVRKFADRARAKAAAKNKDADAGKDEGETGRGVLFSSGLIAGGSFCGLLIAGLAVGLGEEGLSVPRLLHLEGTGLGAAMASNWLSVVMFALLGYWLFRIARRKE